ncbi:hypothetical protein BH09ACT3_BH09ACT3_11540 [soil metagenome]
MAAQKLEPARDDADQRAAYWPLPLARAIPAAVLAIVITFSADHSAVFGLTVFAGFAIVSGTAVGIVSRRRLAPGGIRPYLVAHGAITVAAGLFALAVRDGGVSALFLLFTVFAAVTGVLELSLGLRNRRLVASNDWRTVGVITVIAAVLFVLIPPGYRQSFEGAENVSGVIDSAVIAVGLLGAYAAIIAVYLLIAAFSAKWGTQRAAVAAESGLVR